MESSSRLPRGIERFRSAPWLKPPIQQQPSSCSSSPFPADGHTNRRFLFFLSNQLAICLNIQHSTAPVNRFFPLFYGLFIRSYYLMERPAGCCAIEAARLYGNGREQIRVKSPCKREALLLDGSLFRRLPASSLWCIKEIRTNRNTVYADCGSSAGATRKWRFSARANKNGNSICDVNLGAHSSLSWFQIRFTPHKAQQELNSAVDDGIYIWQKEFVAFCAIDFFSPVSPLNFHLEMFFNHVEDQDAATRRAGNISIVDSGKNYRGNACFIKATDDGE